MTHILLITVYRRYHELTLLLDRIQECADEFPKPPEIWVVWAQPCIGHLWFFQELLREEKIQHLITRPPLPGESPKTSFPESHNLRLGLNKILRHHQADENAYVIAHAADVLPHKGTYRFVCERIEAGHRAVLCHWQNGCVQQDVWHTNFFCVPLDEAYWPPLSPLNQQDVLERQWGKLLKERQPPSVCKTHNYNGKRFVQQHLSESLPTWPLVGQPQSQGVSLTTVGYRPWWNRLTRFLCFWCIKNKGA